MIGTLTPAPTLLYTVFTDCEIWLTLDQSKYATPKSFQAQADLCQSRITGGIVDQNEVKASRLCYVPQSLLGKRWAKQISLGQGPPQRLSDGEPRSRLIDHRCS